MCSNRLAAVAAVLTFSLLPAASPAQLAAGDEVVARFAGSELRLSDLHAIVDRQGSEAKQQLLQSPDALDRFVRTEMFRRAVLAEAKATGWDKRPEVQARLDLAREQALVTAYMNDLARPPASYPGEDELQAYYRSAQAELIEPRRLRIAQIYVAAEDAADAGRKRKAEDLASRARARPEAFAGLARGESEHEPSARSGGDLGWLTETEMLPELRQATARAVEGEVIGPVRGARGWHVLHVADIRPRRARPFSEVREALVAAMRLRKAQENERRHLDEMAARSPLEVNQIALGRFATEAGKP
jgi:peptidylprolyl isomerase